MTAMLDDWMFWIGSLHPNEWALCFLALLIFDTPRYVLPLLGLWLWDAIIASRHAPSDLHPASGYGFCPSVCVIIAGYNAGDSIAATILTLRDVYPCLEVIVVDDGSEDNMLSEARRAARDQPRVRVLSRPRRGGKPSAINFALAYTRAQIIIGLDGESQLDATSIWEIVQPFQDPKVGAVSAPILVSGWWKTWPTWFQAYEYRQSVFLARIVAARLGILGICSGAFFAVRREVLDLLKGWDLGPPDDLDLTLRVRKVGYQVAFAPHAQCYDSGRMAWWPLLRQRLRWDQGSVVRNHCRRHVDMAYCWQRHFRLSNLIMLADSWLYQLVLPYAFVVSVIYLSLDPPPHLGALWFSFYLIALGIEVIRILALLFYTSAPGRDLAISMVFPFMPVYRLVFLVIRIIANTRELIWRKSFDDNIEPIHVRQAAWRW